jgi:hypothetical protein
MSKALLYTTNAGPDASADHQDFELMESWPFVRDIGKSRPTFLCAIAAVHGNGSKVTNATGAKTARVELRWRCDARETKS